MLGVYLSSTSFRLYLPDWIFVGVLVVLFAIVERASPFERKFSLEDITIQHPFAHVERVSDELLYILTGILPAICIVLIVFWRRKVGQLTHFDALHLLSVSLLGFSLTYIFTGVVTDVLKVWISRPRPDFLDRCGPKKKTSPTALVGLEVCTMPLGEMYLLDGMKLTPSGHSSLSFAGLLYFSLWIVGQFKLVNLATKLWVWLVVPTIPIILAVYIALSRTQDYRHHFFDVILGLAIGVAISWKIYFRIFLGLNDKNSDKDRRELEEKILP